MVSARALLDHTQMPRHTKPPHTTDAPDDQTQTQTQSLTQRHVTHTHLHTHRHRVIKNRATRCGTESSPAKKGSVTATKQVKTTYKVLISNLVMILLRVHPHALNAASIMSNTGILYICMPHNLYVTTACLALAAISCHPATIGTDAADCMLHSCTHALSDCTVVFGCHSRADCYGVDAS